MNCWKGEMNKVKRNTIFIVILLILFSNIIFAEDNYNLLPEDKDLYAIISETELRRDNNYVLNVKIIKLNLSTMDKEKFRLVENFQTDMYMQITTYPEHDFYRIEGKSGNMFILKYNEPWNCKVLSMIGIGPSFSYSEDGNTYLCQIFFEKLVFLNLNNWEEKEYEIIEGSYAAKVLYEKGQNLGFNIKDGKFKMIPNEKPYLYEPPEEIIGNAETAVVIFNKEKYRMIHFNEYDEQGNNIGKEALLNKKENRWVFFKIGGKRKYTYIFDPFIIYCISNSKPNKPIVFNGNFEIINYLKEEKHAIYLEPPSNIYIANENYAIATSKNRILYLPVIDGKINVEKVITLYEESEEVIGTPQEIVKRIEGLFLGPAEVPEEILLKKAEEANKKGEKLYNMEDKNRAISQSILALEYYPDYAYCNLGLYNIPYEIGIEYSLKAIELSEDEIIKARAYNNIGMAYEKRQEWEKALEAYENAYELHEQEAYKEAIERMEDKL